MADLFYKGLKSIHNFDELDVEDELAKFPDRPETPQEYRNAKITKAVREKRNNELLATDKYLLEDFPISASNLTKIKTYRAALRDLPETQFGLTEGTHGLVDFMKDWPEVPDLS